MLNESKYCTELSASHFKHCSVLPYLGPPPADMTGLIVGVVFGVLGAIVIILLIVGGVIWYCQSSSHGKL